MDFILIKTSDYGDFRPLELPNVRVEEGLGEWYKDDEDKKRNVISLSSLDELIDLAKFFGRKLVIIPVGDISNEDGKYPIIEIYDFYRE